MKIVFFVGSLFPGGTQNYLLRFLHHIQSQNDGQITIICKLGRFGELEDEFRKLNVELIPLKLSFLTLSNYLKLLLLLRRIKPDVVCDFSGNFAAFPLLVSFIVGVKNRISFFRASEDRFTPNFFKNLYNKVLNRIMINVSTQILSNSKYALNNYLGDSVHRIQSKVIYNGIKFVKATNHNNVSLRKSLGISEEAFIIGHSGRYNKTKNHSTILQVAIELCKKYPDVYFLLCGGKVKDNLNKIVLDHSLENRIFLFNYLEDIPYFLESLDLFYFPSITEGQPNSLIEAMCCGVPIVASDIEPIKEVIPEFLLEFLVPCYDVHKAVNTILYIKKNYHKYPKLQMKEYANSSFNPDRLFDEFYKCLLN